jgi:uncharacterized iron-regulated membrane protein
MSRPLSLVLLGLGLGVVAEMAAHGWSYYTLDAIARVDHDAHAILRASGSTGRLYGVVGTVLILVNLLYFVRKHARILRGRGSLRTWMEVHVFAGLAGSALIVFHSAMQVRNQLAASASWALAILVTTGLIGRYMYGLLPRSESGEEEGEAAVKGRLSALRRELGERLREVERDPVWALLASFEGSRMGALGALAQLPALPFERLRQRRQLAGVARLIEHPGRTEAERLLLVDLATAALDATRRLTAITLYRELFTWWRALHRAFAIVMVLAVLLHVGVALYYGYAWG